MPAVTQEMIDEEGNAMAKNGYRIFDSDTHVGPSMELLEPYLSATERQMLEGVSQYRRGRGYSLGERKYDRILGDAEPRPADAGRYMGGRFTGAHKGKDPNPRGDYDASARIADLDYEGVDVNLLLPSGWFGCWTAIDDTKLEVAMYRAYHRWMRDYCSAYPERLTGVILVSGRNVDDSLAELHRAAQEPWAMSVFAYAPYGMPLDHPSLEPYWAAAQEYDLSVVLHTFTVMPPYAPGGLDTWDNLFLQRAAAHPWCGMRNMASIIGGGVLDRYPDLRLGVLEAGHGWLPAWIKRLDEHAESVAAALPELEQPPSEYVTSGRYFQSIEMSEGEGVTRMVSELLGDDLLMYASDYPHGESWYPISVETVMAWEMPPERKRKLFWDNAVNFYRRYRALAPRTAVAG
jgi:predicted TIM-barrel fold metal-dependent hydrolase